MNQKQTYRLKVNPEWEVFDRRQGRVWLRSVDSDMVTSFADSAFESDFDFVPKTEARRGFAMIECFPDSGVAYPCYYLSETWNGWDIPYFTYDTGMLLLRQVNSPESDLALAYGPDSDVFYANSPDHQEVFPSRMVSYGGQNIKVYAIGGRSWTWDVYPVEVPVPR
jgi:hypothetical protein